MAREQKGRMDEERLRAVLDAEIRQANGFTDDQISEDRRENLEFYYARPLGNEIEGRSQFVSSDVQDVVEGMMPDMMEIFASGDKLVTVDPVGPEDEDTAIQATDYLNYVWMKDNDGFSILHDCIKDALLQKTGVIKIWWEDEKEEKRESYENLNSLALQELEKDPDIEIVEYEESPAHPDMGMFFPDGVSHEVTVIRTHNVGRLKIMGVPPEEFLISRRSVELEDADFTCHKTLKTVSELREMGFSDDIIESLPTHDSQTFNEERIARFADDQDWPEYDSSLDPSMRSVWIYECYAMIDYDGDGISEMRQVLLAGPGYKVLSNEAVDHHPFAAMVPIRMPHKFFGRAVADLVKDIQIIKSTVERQMLDNMYLMNNSRSAINDRVDIDDYLSSRPGGYVQVEGEGPVSDSIQPIMTQPLGSYAMQMIEYFDQTREERTGMSRLDQGIDPDAMNKTATGINLMMGRSQKRKLFVARTLAIGLRAAMKKTYALITSHQTHERIIRLRGNWVPMDPRSWNTEMDVTVNVGIGTGTNEQKTMAAKGSLDAMSGIIELQGNMEGPLITWQEIATASQKFIGSLGVADPKLLVKDFNGQMPEPKPDPKQQEAQAKMQLEQAKMQMEQQKLQQDGQLSQARIQADMQFKTQKAQQDAQVAQGKAAADIQVQREKAQAELALKREVAEAELNLKRQELGLKSEELRVNTALKQTELETDAQINREKMRMDAEQAERNSQRESARESERSAQENVSHETKQEQPPSTVVVVEGAKQAGVKIVRDKDGNITGAEPDGD
jgi:hypothetical protein